MAQRKCMFVYARKYSVVLDVFGALIHGFTQIGK